MASNAVFTAERTEIGESDSFSVRRTGWSMWDASLPWGSLSDCIQVLTEAYSTPPGSVARGSIYQVQTIYDGSHRPKTIIQWLGTQDDTYVLGIFFDEIPALASVLSDLAPYEGESLDLDFSSASWRNFVKGVVRALYSPSLNEPDQSVIEEAVGSQVGAVKSVNAMTGDVVLGKEDVGLSEVDNTSDLDKPISASTQTALDLKANIVDVPTSPGDVGAAAVVHQHNASDVTGGVFDVARIPSLPISKTTGLQTALDGKINSIVAGSNVTIDNSDPRNPVISSSGGGGGGTGGAVSSVNGMTGDVVISKGTVGLGQVDNTSDANKPISNAVAAVLNGRLSKASLDADYAPLLEGVKARTLTGSALPSAWTDRVSIAQVGSTADGWPMTLSTVLTVRHSAGRIIQIITHKEDARTMIRAVAGSDSWTPWKELVGDSDIATLLSNGSSATGAAAIARFPVYRKWTGSAYPARIAGAFNIFVGPTNPGLAMAADDYWIDSDTSVIDLVIEQTRLLNSPLNEAVRFASSYEPYTMMWAGDLQKDPSDSTISLSPRGSSPNQHMAWALPSTGVSRLYGGFIVPDGWSSFQIEPFFYHAQSGATGNVYFTVTATGQGNGSSITGGGLSQSGSISANAVNIVRNAGLGSWSCVPDQLVSIMFARNANSGLDTLKYPIYLLGFRIRRTA